MWTALHNKLNIFQFIKLNKLKQTATFYRKYKETNPSNFNKQYNHHSRVVFINETIINDKGGIKCFEFLEFLLLIMKRVIMVFQIVLPFKFRSTDSTSVKSTILIQVRSHGIPIFIQFMTSWTRNFISIFIQLLIWNKTGSINKFHIKALWSSPL